MLLSKTAKNLVVETLLVMATEEQQRLDLTLACMVHENNDEILAQLFDEAGEIIKRKAALNSAVSLLGGNPLP